MSEDTKPRRGRPPGSRNSVRELPDGPVDDLTGLTPRQQKVLIFLREEIEQRGYPPSMREIGAAVGLASTSSVAHQLQVLEKLGYVKRDPNRPRALEIFLPDVLKARRTLSSADESIIDETGFGDARPDATYVPMVGRIAAGGPILAEERIEEVFPLPKSLVGDGTLFLLEVSGDSMIDAAICSGDSSWCASSRSPRTARSSPPCSTARPRSRRSSARTARSGCSRTTTTTPPSTAPTPRSWARSPRSSVASEARLGMMVG